MVLNMETNPSNDFDATTLLKLTEEALTAAAHPRSTVTICPEPVKTDPLVSRCSIVFFRSSSLLWGRVVSTLVNLNIK